MARIRQAEQEEQATRYHDVLASCCTTALAIAGLGALLAILAAVIL